MGVLLLAGQSYPATAFKDMAEALYEKGYAVYCLPFPDPQENSWNTIFLLNRKKVAGGVALLQKYSRAQYVACSNIEFCYLIKSDFPTSVKGLILLPDRRENSLINRENTARTIVQIKRRLKRPEKRTFQEYIYYASLIKKQMLNKGLRFKKPVLNCSSVKYQSWIKDIITDSYQVEPASNVSLDLWGNTDHQKLINFIQIIENKRLSR